jgi:hypothetical protein
MNSKKLQNFLTICITLLLAYPTLAEQAKVYDNKKQLYQISKVKLPKHNKRAYSKFRAYRGIGAFAVDLSGRDNTWARVTGYHNLGTAKKTAIRGCKSLVPKAMQSQADCQIYAVTIPKEMDIDDDKSLVMSSDTNFIYRREFLKKHKAGSFSAFAMANNTAYGFSTQQSSKEQAKKMALLFCNSRAKSTSKDWRVLKKSEGCRIVNVLGSK